MDPLSERVKYFTFLACTLLIPFVAVTTVVGGAISGTSPQVVGVFITFLMTALAGVGLLSFASMNLR